MSRRILTKRITSTVFSALIFVAGISSVWGQSFVFNSGISKYDAPFVDAKNNIAFNTKIAGLDTVFHAGEFWDQVWTRDGSYSIQMACGLLNPSVSRKTFDYTTKVDATPGPTSGKRIQLQDQCASFGTWPVLTDGIVWATGAWAYFTQTGDAQFPVYAYDVIRNSLLKAETEVFRPKDSLFGGCSSFMESRSSYPGHYYKQVGWPDSVRYSMCGSTNVLYYNGYVYAAKFAQIIKKPQNVIDSLTQKAERLKNAINRQLWNSAKGYYYYYKDNYGGYNQNNEGLMDAFAILYDVADSAKKASILKKTIPSSVGYVCQYPQFPEWSNWTMQFSNYYHSNMIWPFVQGYIAWAATKMKDTAVFMNNMDNLAKLWAKMTPGQFKEFYFPPGQEAVQPAGAPGGGGQQLWSAAGYISMVFHGLFGMAFEVDGIAFDPVVPNAFTSKITLTNFLYRKMKLNLSVQGPGKYIKEFKLDGAPVTLNFVPATLTGTHTVDMVLSWTPPTASTVNVPAAAGAARVIARLTAQGDVRLEFRQLQDVSVTLFDIAGRTAGTFVSSNGAVTIGKNSINTGTYLVRWRSRNGSSGTEKMVFKHL